MQKIRLISRFEAENIVYLHRCKKRKNKNKKRKKTFLNKKR